MDDALRSFLFRCSIKYDLKVWHYIKTFYINHKKNPKSHLAFGVRLVVKAEFEPTIFKI